VARCTANIVSVIRRRVGTLRSSSYLPSCYDFWAGQDEGLKGDRSTPIWNQPLRMSGLAPKMGKRGPREYPFSRGKHHHE
jgi:hypothetical protein